MIAQFLAIKLKGTDCKVSDSDVAEGTGILLNDLFNGGCKKFGKDTACWVLREYDLNEKKIEDVLLGHCRESRAAMVFMFMATALLLASALMGFLRRRKGY